jgi:NADPH-dependent ferric siderophore reductase
VRADEYGGIEWAPPPPGDGPLLLVGDETAVPAIASILETLPAGYDGRAILEVASAEDFIDVRTDADVEVVWLARSTYPRGAQLLAAVRSLVPAQGAPAEPVSDVDPDGLVWETPTGERADGAPYAWIAGEAGVVRDLRRYLVGDAGLPRSSVAFMGYWRVGRALG